MYRIKSAVSILLALVMAFGVTTFAFAASPDDDFPWLTGKNAVSCTVQTDKEKYAYGDTITFTVTAENVSENALTDVRIKVTPRHQGFITPAVAESEIGPLQSGDKAEVQIVFQTRKLSFMDRIYLFFSHLLDSILDNTAGGFPRPHYDKVRVGGDVHDFRIEAQYQYEPAQAS